MKTFILATGVLVIALVVALLVQHQTEIALRQQNESLQQRVTQLTEDNERLLKHPPTPHLPAPIMHFSAQPNALSTDDLPATNLFTRFKDQAPKLTAEQIEAYLKANGRKASSLLAAYRTSGDPALLKEAMEKYPNDPQVAFEAAINKDLSPEQRRAWLDAFKQADPNNALANYLSARDYIKAGQMDLAVQELVAASGKQQFQDYTLDRAQDDEEAYLSAGYSAAEAERIAMSWLEAPQLVEVKQLGRDLVALSSAYSQSGDPASAQAALQMAMNMGQRYGDTSANPTLLSQLVGMSIQTLALEAMNPNSPFGATAQTVQDQLNQLAQQREAIKELVRQAQPFMPTLSDQDMLIYENRRMRFGELAALQWVASRGAQK